MFVKHRATMTISVGLALVLAQPALALAGESPASIPRLLQPVASEIRRESNGFWLFLNGVRTPAWTGIVYQRTEGTRHILSYSNSIHSLFKPLDDEKEGGLGDGNWLESMGIKMIRIYELPVEDQDDALQVKAIFRRLFHRYGIRVLVGDWAGVHAGMDFTSGEDKAKLKAHLRKLVATYAGEPWVLGWQLGNENNYYLSRGRLGSMINLDPAGYYALMDQLAGEVRDELGRMGIRQFVALGQGDLNVGESRLIAGLNNIDAVGINCYRSDPKEFGTLLAMASTNLTKTAIYFSEIGYAASSSFEQEQQAEYLNQACAVISSFAAGRLKSGSVLGTFIHEATDQLWKREERHKESDAHFGVLGKSTVAALRYSLNKQNDFFEDIVPTNQAPVNLIEAAWRCLGMTGTYGKKYGRDYGNAEAYAQQVISLYQGDAARQQAALATNANEGVWALDAVGTGYFIRGYRWMLQAYDLSGAQGARAAGESIPRQPFLHRLAQWADYDVVQAADRSVVGDPLTNASVCMRSAKDVFEELMNRFPRAQLRSLDGQFRLFDRAIQSRFPELSPPYLRLTWRNGITFVLGALVLMLLLSRLASRHLGLTKIRTEPAMGLGWRITFLLALILELASLFLLSTWWFHPVRLHFYAVRSWLFWPLSAIGVAGILFYQIVWILVWTARRPVWQPPRLDYRVAIVTTRVALEPAEEVEATLDRIDAVQYPHDSYLLDEENSPEAKYWCIRRNAIHFSRKDIPKYNEERGIFQRRTKGGNLNAWLYEHGAKYDFVVFMDPDHAPHRNFLDRVLGYFADPKVAFVQAPHIYHNRLATWIARGGAEQSYFFCGPIQMGLFGMGACVINGSHTTIRISDLFATKERGYAVHDADDILTTVRLQAVGKVGIYVPEVLAEGLVPESWTEFIKQQRRWASSMFNLFWYYYPTELIHVPWPARIGHALLCAFYLIRLSFVLLLILPFVALVFGNPPVNAHLGAFCFRYIPFLTAHMLILCWLGRKLLIEGGSHRGFWYRAGILWIASWWDFLVAFIKGSLSRRVKSRDVVVKWTPARRAPWLYVLPHLVLTTCAILMFSWAVAHRPQLETVWGQLIFLVLIVFSQGFVALRVLLKPETVKKDRNIIPDHL